MNGQRASDRVRLRLKEELATRKISQQELAHLLTAQTGETWTKSRVGHVLNGHVELRVDDADAIARVVKLFLTEAVRDRGLEFYAEMTPTALRVLERLRLRPHTIHGLMLLLDMATPTAAPVPKRAKRGRPLNSALAKRQW